MTTILSKADIEGIECITKLWRHVLRCNCATNQSQCNSGENEITIIYLYQQHWSSLLLRPFPLDLLWGRIGQFDLRRLILSYRSQRPIHHESHTPHPTQLNLCTAGFQVIKYVLRFQVPAEPTTGLVTDLNSSGWLTVQSLNGAQRPFPAKGNSSTHKLDE